ncbi:hypothetical protein [Streptomyces alboflavus]|uniref:hypothetical protein n=1 Tax=Streptomyces alboflavus TaxID=67267 RepID=UPI000F658BE0|nr:hypothetical protein [Streptomyces alboflavus]
MAAPDPTRGSDSEESPFRKRGFIVSAAFLSATLLLGVVVVLSTGGDDDGKSAGDGPSSAPAASPSSNRPQAPADGDGCPKLADDRTKVPDAAPAGVTWELFRTMALPASKTSGPAVEDGDVARCYARTPTGALMAAAQISIRAYLAQDWRTVMKEQTYGDARDGFIRERAKKEEKDPPPPPEPGELGQFAGFRFVTYDRNTAVVELVTRFSDPGVLQVSTVTVQWRDGDWRYQISDTHAQPKAVDSLDGYAAWGGV